MKNMLCRLLGHRWEHKWHRHHCYFGVQCTRCGKQIHRTTKNGKKELQEEKKELLIRFLIYLGLFVSLVLLFTYIWFALGGV